MNLYVTEIKAIKPSTGCLTTYGGPNVPGISAGDAQDYCENNGLGYCKVIGLLVDEIPCKKGTYEPDWENMVSYENTRDN
jgi:hypothetical protein